jgi:hypothetical protein
MPSPIGHALGGAIVAMVLARFERDGERVTTPGALREPGSGPDAPASDTGTVHRRPHSAPRAGAPAVTGRASGPSTRGAGLGLAARLVIVAAILPDIDFLWGRHNMETHSLGAAVLAGLVVLAVSRGRRPRLALAVSVAWASHVLFDWLGSDAMAPVGVMALWPMSTDFFFAHVYLFEAVERRTWLPDFWSRNLWAVGREVALLGPLAAFAAWRRRPRRAAR